MQTKSFFINCADGHQMPVYAWLPDTEPLCILHIAHGMAEYALRYAPIAALLVEQGIAVYAHDERAHGKAVPTIGEQGIAEPDWFYKQVDDLHLMMQYLHGAYPQQKVFLLGHSMGSFICQRFFQMHGKDIDGIILSATNGKTDPLMGFGIALAWVQMKLFGHRYRSKLIDKLSFQKFNKAFAPNRTDHDWLSRDEKEVDKYVADPQCGWVSSATFFYYFFKGIKDAFSQDNIDRMPKNIPVYAFAGDKDPVGLQGKGFLELINKWKAAGLADISYTLYPDGRHETMNDIKRVVVVGELVAWLRRHL
ncbi:MAG: alpha/beta fold hydrolase [Chitinophagaceae bacterium]